MELSKLMGSSTYFLYARMKDFNYDG